MKSEISKKADIIQRAVEENVLKNIGFIRKGRIYNRKTKDGLTQVIEFWIYRKYEGDPTTLVVELGIRVPECVKRKFDCEEVENKFFTAAECNLRTSIAKLNVMMGKGDYKHYYYLDKGDKKYEKVTEDKVEDIISEICVAMTQKGLPLFEDLSSRDKIVSNLEKCINLIQIPGRWQLGLIYIYGARGELDKAKALFSNLKVDSYIVEEGKRLGLI